MHFTSNSRNKKLNPAKRQMCLTRPWVVKFPPIDRVGKLSGDASKACCFCVDSKSEAVIFGHLDGSLSKYSLSSAAAMGQIRKHTEASLNWHGKTVQFFRAVRMGFVYKYDINALDDVEMLQRLSASIRTIHISADGGIF